MPNMKNKDTTSPESTITASTEEEILNIPQSVLRSLCNCYNCFLLFLLAAFFLVHRHHTFLVTMD